jgi:hypothetical protein
MDLVKDGNRALDIVMQLTSKKAGDIKGESVREFADGKPRIDVMAYHFFGAAATDQSSGLATGRRSYSALRVVRNSDFATASMLKLFSTFDNTLSLVVSVYEASGDPNTKDVVPMLRIGLKAARINSFTVLAGGVGGGGAFEIIDFAFREIELVSQAQMETGIRGGGNVFTDTWAE